MKTFPKVLYATLNGNGFPIVDVVPDHFSAGAVIGVYELRAIKVVKRETVLDDPPNEEDAES